jgi:hypothetical protein
MPSTLHLKPLPQQQIEQIKQKVSAVDEIAEPAGEEGQDLQALTVNSVDIVRYLLSKQPGNKDGLLELSVEGPNFIDYQITDNGQMSYLTPEETKKVAEELQKVTRESVAQTADINDMTRRGIFTLNADLKKEEFMDVIWPELLKVIELFKQCAGFGYGVLQWK